jgi:nicotinamide-nucleotide amidase
MFTETLRQQAGDLLDLCRQKGLMLATAESCTGGLLSALLTDIPGSSSVFERGFITYSNASKITLLGVANEPIAAFGAVSEPVAAAMAQGALQRAGVDIAVSLTGIAGPDGGTALKPVGLVYIAVATRQGVIVDKNLFAGERSQVRLQSVAQALVMLQATAEALVYVA